MKFRGFTLVEQMIALIIIGILGAVLFNTLRPNDVKTQTLKKVAKSVFVQIEFATKSVLAKNTVNYSFLRLKDTSGEFSIASADSLSRLIELYKKSLIGLRGKTLEATYSSSTLTDGTTSITGLSPSSFSGFFIKNGTYFGIKLHGNCTTTIDYIYDPSTPDKRTRTNTCGIIFFDLNAQSAPNILGIDQYIVALGKLGVK